MQDSSPEEITAAARAASGLSAEEFRRVAREMMRDQRLRGEDEAPDLDGDGEIMIAGLGYEI